MFHISSKTTARIEEVVGRFVLVSFNCFTVDDETRTRYTVTKPNGKKHIHLIQYASGVVVKA